MFLQAKCLLVIDRQYKSEYDIVQELRNLNILDVVFKKSYFENKVQIDNFIKMLPQNTVISKKITGDFSASEDYFVSLPFFSSHFKVPVKRGENIWIFPYTNKFPGKINSNSFWISRVHGYKVSEDVNYTFSARDKSASNGIRNYFNEISNESETKSNKKRELKSHKKDISGGILKPIVGFSKEEELTFEEAVYLNNSVMSQSLRAVPSIHNNSEDLILQGSNNTLIELTSQNNLKSNLENKNKGEINILSGMGKYENLDSIVEIGFFINKIGEVQDDSFAMTIKQNSTIPVEILHIDSQISENFKMPEIYDTLTNVNNLTDFRLKSLLNDASRITLSENYSYFNDSITTQNIPYYEELESIKEINAFLKDENKKKNVFYYKPIFSRGINSSLPSISLVSSNIEIYSRKEGNNISLTKEYELVLNDKEKVNSFSFVRLSKNGDIFIDGSRIFIGSSSIEKTKSGFKNGKGTVIRLGESEESQSLVLGEQLKVFLQEFLDVSREDMQDTKTLFLDTKKSIEKINKKLIDEFNLKLNSSLSTLGSNSSKITAISSLPQVPGPALATQLVAIYATISDLILNLQNAILQFQKESLKIQNKLKENIDKKQLNRDQELSLRLQQIENNIDKILSKISKTS